MTDDDRNKIGPENKQINVVISLPNQIVPSSLKSLSLADRSFGNILVGISSFFLAGTYFIPFAYGYPEKFIEYQKFGVASCILALILALTSIALAYEKIPLRFREIASDLQKMFSMFLVAVPIFFLLEEDVSYLQDGHRIFCFSAVWLGILVIACTLFTRKKEASIES